ncbi:MAG: RrF2 family transcriptional regulator [Terriglobales bacterium]
MLSTTSEYALRALSILAALPQGASILGRDLARHTGIPARYLAKVLTILHNAGLVGTARGSNGGYWLSRSADSIRIQEVVALFDSAALRRSCLLWPGGLARRSIRAQPTVPGKRFEMPTCGF